MNRHPPRRSPRPIAVSQKAKRDRARCGDRYPHVSVSSVRLARTSAGLRSGNNFKSPNHKKTLPRQRRSNTTLYEFISIAYYYNEPLIWYHSVRR